MKRILVFHRNCLFRDCLASYLEANGKFETAARDHTSANTASGLIEADTDVILLDLNLPRNLAKEIVETTRRAFSRTKVVLLVPDDHQSLFECMAAGVQGCVLERSALPELQAAIESVLSGETFCSSEFGKLMFSEVAKFGQAFSWQQPSGAANSSRLTAREQEVLELIAERKCNKEIAKALSVSLYTVKNHVHNILEKLQVQDRVSAVAAARQENLLGKF